MKTLPAQSVDEAQLELLEQARKAMPAGSELGETLGFVADAVRSGSDVTFVDDETRLTPNQAAKLLGMSRTHLYKLLDAGVIASTPVGRDRRITAASVREYRAAQDDAHADLAVRFAHHDRRRKGLLNSLDSDPGA